MQYYVRERVLANVDANRAFYEARGDYEGLHRFESWFFRAMHEIADQPEQGVSIAELPATHRRLRFDEAHCYIYYRIDRRRDVVIIYWIKWDGQGTNYRPSTLARLATEAAKESRTEDY